VGQVADTQLCKYTTQTGTSTPPKQAAVHHPNRQQYTTQTGSSTPPKQAAVYHPNHKYKNQKHLAVSVWSHS